MVSGPTAVSQCITRFNEPATVLPKPAGVVRTRRVERRGWDGETGAGASDSGDLPGHVADSGPACVSKNPGEVSCLSLL